MNFLVVAALVLSFALAISVCLFGFGLIGLAFEVSRKGGSRVFFARMFGWGCAIFVFVMCVAYAIGAANGARNDPASLIIALFAGCGAYVAFRKAGQYEK